MSSTVISEAYLTIAVVIAASVLSSAFTVGLTRVQDLQREQLNSYQEKIEVQVKIIYVHAKQNNNTIIVWIKNVGTKTLPMSLVTDGSDVYFGNSTDYRRVTYNGGSNPKWTVTLENDIDGDGRWDPKETIKVVITWATTLSTGDYMVKMVTYLGTKDDYTFSV